MLTLASDVWRSENVPVSEMKVYVCVSAVRRRRMATL